MLMSGCWRAPPMEKFGVACKCAEGAVEVSGMEKLGTGEFKCGHCGRIHKLDRLVLKDEISLKEQPLKSP